jgi:hypothetical protein
MFRVKPNTGVGDCFYLSIIDSLQNKHLTARFLRYMGKTELTVQNLRHFMAEHSEWITHYAISSILNMPTQVCFSKEITDYVAYVKRKMNPEMIQKKLECKTKQDIGLPFLRQATQYIHSHIFGDKCTDDETKRIQFVEFYKKYMKKAKKWVCFVEVFLFEIMYAEFIRREFGVEAKVVITNCAPDFTFQYDAKLYLSNTHFHFEAWVFKKRKKFII